MVVGVGFEPTYATRGDLQSPAFNHSATPPLKIGSHINVLIILTLLNLIHVICLYTQAFRNRKGLIRCQ